MTTITSLFIIKKTFLSWKCILLPWECIIVPWECIQLPWKLLLLLLLEFLFIYELIVLKISYYHWKSSGYHRNAIYYHLKYTGYHWNSSRYQMNSMVIIWMPSITIENHLVTMKISSAYQWKSSGYHMNSSSYQMNSMVTIWMSCITIANRLVTMENHLVTRWNLLLTRRILWLPYQCTLLSKEYLHSVTIRIFSNIRKIFSITVWM